MQDSIYGRLACLVLTAGIFIMARPAGATLGGSASSVAADRTALAAVHRAVTPRGAYSVSEFQSAGTTVREYVSSGGVVFAVAWNGLTPPDLTVLLGSYAAEYRAALKKTPRARGIRHQQVQSERVVVQHWGHMRNLQGRAYAPALIPTGVTIDDIR